MQGTHRLKAYADLIEDPESTPESIHRAIVCNLPRRLHAMSRGERRAALRDAPPLTHTPWDALLAATAEHVAQRHGDPLEPWMDESERFVDTPWFGKRMLGFMRWEALCFSPAAFIRHGTPVHPSNLDERGGDERWMGGAMEGVRPELGKEDILDLLDSLSERLRRKRATARLYVISGACISRSTGQSWKQRCSW